MAKIRPALSIKVAFLYSSLLTARLSNVRATTKLLNPAAPQAEKFQEEEELQLLEYGVDVSFPMHHMPSSMVVDDDDDDGEKDKDDSIFSHGASGDDDSSDQAVKKALLLSQFTKDRLHYYKNHFLQGCINAFGEGDCLRAEQERIQMNMRQPASMKNMTKGLGFHKFKVPAPLFQMLQKFFEENRGSAINEHWAVGSTYVNHWESLPTVIRVDNRTLKGGGYELVQSISDTLRQILSDWTDGSDLVEASIYGVRIYHTGAVLATHVDRNPLVSSAIINIDQDVDEPWPLEVIGSDGRAYNITMEPGDLVLYESHSLLHGRPFPLQGRFMANIFVHFEPVSPNGRPNDPPIYRLPMKPTTKKCKPTVKNGHIICNWD